MTDRMVPEALKSSLVKKILAMKMGVEAGALRRAPDSAVRHYMTEWDPVERMASQLRYLPTGLLRFLSDQREGYIQITSSETRYEPGAVDISRHSRRCVAFVAIPSLEDLIASFLPIMMLLDHLLGCGGARDGEWLSDGGGLTTALMAVGKQVRSLFELEYLRDVVENRTSWSRHAYFAVAGALYVSDRQKLNTADPGMERLLRQTIMSEPFWERWG